MMTYHPIKFGCKKISRSKTHKRLKEHFLIGRNRTKHANFQQSPLFQDMYIINTDKQTIQLILCQLDAGRLAEGKGHETDSRELWVVGICSIHPLIGNLFSAWVCMNMLEILQTNLHSGIQISDRKSLLKMMYPK